MIQDTTKIGKRGSLVIPVALRNHFDLQEGIIYRTELDYPIRSGLAK